MKLNPDKYSFLVKITLFAIILVQKTNKKNTTKHYEDTIKMPQRWGKTL
jgi:hypothetical protein